MLCGDLSCDVAVAAAVAGAGAGDVRLARFSGAVFEDAGLCVFGDSGLTESSAELFLVRAAVVAVLQGFNVVAGGVVCMFVASGCAFLDVMPWLEEVMLPVAGGGDDDDDAGDDGDGGEVLDAP